MVAAQPQQTKATAPALANPTTTALATATTASTAVTIGTSSTTIAMPATLATATSTSAAAAAMASASGTTFLLAASPSNAAVNRAHLLPTSPMRPATTTMTLLNNCSPPSSPLQLFAETDPMLCGDGGHFGQYNEHHQSMQQQHLYIDQQLQPRAYPPEALTTLDNAEQGGAAAHGQHVQAQQGPSDSSSTSAAPGGQRVMINEHGEMVEDQRTLVVIQNNASAEQINSDMDTMDDQKEKRIAPTSKDKLVDRKRFTMSDLVKWKPKTENTLKRKWAERRKQLTDGETEEEQEAQSQHQQQKGLPAVINGKTSGGGQAGTATQPQQQGPSMSNNSSGSATAAGPRVMINERGEMVVDEQSLVVVENPEQNTAEMETVNDDLLPKRISSLSFRRKHHRSSVWGVLETDLFYEVLSATGTDFGLMHEFIPTRTRVELKNKFNREERINSRRLNEALQNPTMLDERLRHRVERMLEQMADQ